MIPKKPAPDTIRGGYRFRKKITLQKLMLQRYELVPAGWIEQPTFAL